MLSLHLPDEPVGRASAWLEAVQSGSPFDEVLGGDDGITAWLWSRWSMLGSAGMSRDQFAGLVAGYRRELWLWLAGERTWSQACAGLVGRITRRLPSPDAPQAG